MAEKRLARLLRQIVYMPHRPARPALTGAFLCLAFCVFPGFAQYVPNRYALFLSDPPVAARFPAREQLRSAAATTYRQAIQAQHRTVVRELESRNFKVVGEVSTILNAIFVVAPASRLPELESLSGIVGVRPMRRGRRKLNRATQLLNAPAAWSLLGGQQNAGQGMKIAIMDTGIDQTHPAFQDSLPMPTGYPICTTGHPEDCAYTNNKVIVARSYVRQIAAGTDPANPAADSKPDDFSPRDRDGHGTAVASCAAADENTGAVTFTGMAPKAYLGNYKIYGSDGVNDYPPEDVWIQAIEDALKDGMDVANLSSGLPALSGALDTGSACGISTGMPCDPLATAFENAAKAGLVITVSAGNEGSDASQYPGYDSIGSPAIAPSVISVGATMNSHVMQPTVSVTSANAPSNVRNLVAMMSDSFFYPSIFGSNQAPLVDVSQLGNDGYACAPLPANSLVGSYALVERGPSSNPCTFATKAQNVQAAGAIGLIVYMYDATEPFNLEGVDSFSGPAVMISNGDGTALKAYIDANPGKMVTIDSAGREQDVATYSDDYGFIPPLQPNSVLSFSSFGPTPDGAIKPDIMATGGFDGYQSPDPSDSFLPAPSGVYVAAQNYDPAGEVYSSNRYAAADGTSFSSPLTAGAAALVKQKHPNFTPAQIKSALVNGAAQSVTADSDGLAMDVEEIGGGLVDAGAAVNVTVTSEPATISFGFLKSGSLPLTKSLTITNTGSSSVTLAVAVAANKQATGATLAVDQPSLALAAGAAATLKVTLSGSLPAAGEYSGAITLQGTGVSMRIPYMFLVGDGQPFSAVSLGGTYYYGSPGQDAGAIWIQVVDQYGVPVAGTPVTFANPSGTVTLKSVSGEPACSATTVATTLSCPTDNYGIAWAEVTLGSTSGTVTVNARAAGTRIPVSVETLATPAITSTSVVNAASFTSPIAPGSYISIFGNNLVDTGYMVNPNGDIATLTSTGALPVMIDETAVSFDVPSAGISVPGHLVFVSPTQVNVQVPWELQGQSSVQVKVTVDQFIFGNVVTIPLADATPSLFEIATGVAAALDQNNQVISPSHPVTRGTVAQLYVNGLGAVTNQPASGDPASGTSLSTTTSQPVVMIGGQNAAVQFSGLAPGFPGLYQINVTVPAGLSVGNQSITVALNGQTSKASGIVVQ